MEKSRPTSTDSTGGGGVGGRLLPWDEAHMLEGEIDLAFDGEGRGGRSAFCDVQTSFSLTASREDKEGGWARAANESHL